MTRRRGNGWSSTQSTQPVASHWCRPWSSKKMEPYCNWPTWLNFTKYSNDADCSADCCIDIEIYCVRYFPLSALKLSLQCLLNCLLWDLYCWLIPYLVSVVVSILYDSVVGSQILNEAGRTFLSTISFIKLFCLPLSSTFALLLHYRPPTTPTLHFEFSCCVVKQNNWFSQALMSTWSCQNCGSFLWNIARMPNFGILLLLENRRVKINRT